MIAGGTTGSSWGISSIFGSSEDRAPVKENSLNKSYNTPRSIEHSLSMIQLREVSICASYLITIPLCYLVMCIWFVTSVIAQPPIVLKPSENQTEQEALEIAITKLLLKSYYDIVRKNIEDSVPKAIIHFLVNGLIQAMKNLLICLFFSPSRLMCSVELEKSPFVPGLLWLSHDSKV